MKKIFIGQGLEFGIDAVEYASRANAILGIRDSGKTFTATKIAEGLFDCGIPFFAFDPIGRWRFLRWPARGGGTGFPVVVVGGAAPDLRAEPDEVVNLVRAAMRAGVSMVIDLYDAKLTKSNWRKIVRESFDAILYENEALGGGLRHVFLEEASEFAPQHVRDGNTYAAVEKLIRMGGNAGIGATIINQRAEEVNKAVLELCDNLFLHRQRGKNSLLSLRKWLDAGNIKPPKQITDAIADLPTGQCFAWLREISQPTRVTVGLKRSFDANRREMSTMKLTGHGSVDVSAFVEKMKAAMAGKKPANDEERQVNEKEADELRQANARLTAENKTLTTKTSELAREVAELRRTVDQRAGPVTAIQSGEDRLEFGASPSMDAIYAEVKRRAQEDPGLLRVLASRPEIEVKVERRVIAASDDTLRGQIAILISEKFFDAGASGNSAFNELKRRGRSVAKPSVYRECDKLAELGFLTKETDGYRAVEGMKVNVI